MWKELKYKVKTLIWRVCLNLTDKISSTNKYLSITNNEVNSVVRNDYWVQIIHTINVSIFQGLIWGCVFSVIGYYYSNKWIMYSVIIFFR